MVKLKPRATLNVARHMVKATPVAAEAVQATGEPYAMQAAQPPEGAL